MEALARAKQRHARHQLYLGEEGKPPPADDGR